MALVHLNTQCAEGTIVPRELHADTAIFKIHRCHWNIPGSAKMRRIVGPYVDHSNATPSSDNVGAALGRASVRSVKLRLAFVRRKRQPLLALFT